MRPSKRIIWRGVSAGALLVCAAVAASVFMPLPSGYLAHEELQSMRITDYHGVLLRETLNSEDGRSRWVPIAEIAPSLQDATIAVEDKRFWYHPGVDPIAVARSAVENVKRLSFSSGGSTLTQQVVKNIDPRPRTLAAKLREAWYALRLERMRSKRAILEEYLNRVSYGGNLRGAEAASLFFFHKHARDLSIAESAFLAGLPNAPSRLDPRTHPDEAQQRQRLVLARMRDQGRITRDEYDRAVGQPLQLQSPRTVFRAPHVCDMVTGAYGAVKAAVVTTTIDEALQEELARVVDQNLRRLAKRHVTNAAVVVIENRTGEVRALIGSRDYFNREISGQVNGAMALRQPGSAVKPLMYAMAFDAGHAASEIIPDIPTAIPDIRGDYVPENYDRRFHGPVSIRTALACSYNVPAVRMLESIGREPFLHTLRACGLTSLTGTADFYGYGLTLGNAEARLIELANAYRIFANRGVWMPSRVVKEARRADGTDVTMPDPRTPVRVFSEEAAFLIVDILSDKAARAPAFGNAFRFPFQCAVKTGTTKDYKDNWTIGCTTRYTVGVWAGNFDGSEMRGVSGVAGAGAIFTEIMTLLHSAPYGIPPADFDVPARLQRVTVCPRSGDLPNDDCPATTTEWCVSTAAPTTRCRVHRACIVKDERGIRSKRVYEMYAPEYAEWMERAGIRRPPADAEPVAAARAMDARGHGVSRLLISSPNDGDCFRIDPALRREYQTITIRGFVPDGAADVRLVIDRGAPVAFGERGVSWTLEKGVHHFQLIAMLKNEPLKSRSVRITVE